MKFTQYVVESNMTAMNANNLGVYMENLRNLVLSSDTHRMENIGDEITFVPLLMPKNVDNTKKHLLVCSGFHGDENSGPWAIMKYIKDTNSRSANVSYLPMINPVGFKQFKRHTRMGIDVNTNNNNNLPDNVLMNNFGKLCALGVDGVLNLHEDPQKKRDGKLVAYVYQTDDMEDYVTKYILSTLNDHFEILHSDKDDGNYDINVIKGVIKKIDKNTWEGMLEKEGIPCLTSEFSSLEMFKKRVQVADEIITGFVELMA